MTTSTDIANQALTLSGNDGPPITGVAPNFDDSPAGQAAAKFYTPCVQTVARQFGWDFSRNTVALGLSGNSAPVPWSYEYLYPTNGVEVRALLPGTIADPNDPLPVNYIVANNAVSGIAKRVIQTNLANAVAVYTNQPNEDTWDAVFREAVVRLLASEFADALNSKPDTARAMMTQAEQFVEVGTTRGG